MDKLDGCSSCGSPDPKFLSRVREGRPKWMACAYCGILSLCHYTKVVTWIWVCPACVDKIDSELPLLVKVIKTDGTTYPPRD